VQIVVAATADVAIPSLEWLKTSDHNLLRIVTTPDSHAGRGKNLTQSAVGDWAVQNLIPLLKPTSTADLSEAFKNADVVIAIAYGKILSNHVLSIPKFGVINLHFSLLPAYRGAAPVQRAIQNGESITGISIFKIDENLDTGPIYFQEEYEIPSLSNSYDVLKELSVLGARSFGQVLLDIEKGVLPTIQKNTGASLAPKVSKEESRINWSESSKVVTNSIRAFNPSPGSWTMFKGFVLKVNKLGTFTTSKSLQPGEIYIEDKKLFVGTSDRPIEILRVTSSGKREVSVADWLNGARIAPGDHFE
jgi:methionyl-tRNA formyltransferase